MAVPDLAASYEFSRRSRVRSRLDEEASAWPCLRYARGPNVPPPDRRLMHPASAGKEAKTLGIVHKSTHQRGLPFLASFRGAFSHLLQLRADVAQG